MTRVHSQATRWLAVASVVLLSACASSAAPREVGVGPEPGSAQVADRMFFGQSIPGGGTVADSAWRTFLREVVTPRFPDGLTVYRGEGQWSDPRGALVREDVIVVEVIHPRGTPADSVFERIATEYRQRFRQDAVLRATYDVRMVMYAAPAR